MLPIILLMLLLVVLISIYLYCYIKRIFVTLKIDVNNKKVKYIIIAISVIIAVLCSNVFSFGAIIILHVVGVALVVNLTDFIIKHIATKKYEAGFKVWKFIYGIGVIPVVCSAILIIIGYININNVVETKYTIYTEKSIREEGYRVALLADVHYGVSLDYNETQKVCDEISSKNIDIVVLCGDIVDDNTSKEEMEPFFEIVSSIKSKYGIFYVYGNHDRQLYRSVRSYTENELKNVIEENGIIILKDEIYQVNDDLIIAGREDAAFGNVAGRKTIGELLEGVDNKKFILTLDHQPKQYKENSMAGTDLLLSGHTHGGQIWPANILFEIVKFDDAVYGYTKIDDYTQAIVTSGLAGWGFPVKTASPAEYVIIDIKPE